MVEDNNQGQVVCKLCGEADSNPLYSAADFDDKAISYQLVQCTKCCVTFLYPELSQNDINNAYNNTYYGNSGSKFLPVIEAWSRYAAKKRARKLLTLHKSNKSLRVLDIGCGRGVLIAAFESLGHKVVGLERKNSPFHDCANVICDDIHKLKYGKETFDLIILWHVLEHLPDPANTLQTACQLLKPSGSIFIAVPNFGSNQAKIFKKYWFHLDLPRHLFHFKKKSLDMLFQTMGLKRVSHSTFSLDQNIYGFIQSTLNTLPYIPNNHLYSVLKVGINKKTFVSLLLYFPLVSLLTIFAIAELVYSECKGQGACLITQVVKENA